MESARAPRRLAALVAVALALGCGGSQQAPPPAKPGPTAKQRACRAYNARITPFLGRFDAALEQLARQREAAVDDATAMSEALASFAEQIAGELVELREIRSRDAALDAAHRQLVASLEQVGLGHEQLSTAFVIGDDEVRKRAMGRLADGWALWSEASRSIVAQCREQP